MHRLIRLAPAVAGALGVALASAGPAAAGVHLPGRHPKAAIATGEGPWFVRAGAVQDLYANVGKKPLPVVIYLCIRPEGPAAPRVQLQILGRAPIDIQGCQSVYLLLGSGERVAIVNPNPVDVIGTYKLDLQAKVR